MNPRRSLLKSLLLSVTGAGPVLAQFPPVTRRDDEETRLPSGKLQRDEILKADHEKNLDDAGKLIKAAENLRTQLEKSEGYVLSLDMLKQTDEIEKMARRIRSRLKKY